MSLKHHPFLYLLLLLFPHLVPHISAITQPYKPVDFILLNCGSDSGSTSPDGRIWDGDDRSKFLPSYSKASSSAFSASQPDPSFNQVPYTTARIFHSNLTYIFPVSRGSKFVRLYLYPTAYSNLNISESFFSLTANDYLLLRNVSAFLTLSAMKAELDLYRREYIVTVRDNQQLNLTFSASPGSFGFINGIEIVSIPDNLYARGNDTPLTFVGSPYDFYLNNSTALEMFYRLNAGGDDISGSDDTGMYRTWLQDTYFLFGRFRGIIPYHGVPFQNKTQYTSVTPAYTAPESVYATFRSMGGNFSSHANLTWCFSVDGGFNYLVRLHFCETREVVSKEMLEIFEIFINNQIVENDADVIHWSGGNNIPVYRDYVVLIPEGNRGKQDLWLTLSPNFEVKPIFADAILNGVEIFKLNNSEGSLAGSNLELMVVPPPLTVPVPMLHARKKNFSKLAIVAGSVIGTVLVLLLVICVVGFRKRRVVETAKSQAKSSRLPLSHTIRSNFRNISLRPSIPFRRFSIFEIEVATTRFDDELIIGSGGFGNVYKGYIDDGTTPVAIKRLHSSSRQGAREFKTEIQLLAKLHSPHLVALVGYCNDPGEMILVYEYMHKGTLRDHLYKTRNPPIPWKQRLEICIGAARGLNYLHTGVKPPIIHRDVKSTNILIDENWVAKVSDFGLSRTGPTSNSQTHVSTVVRGSFGYVDPEYYRRQHLTEKSDVYSFGVVLLEVLCGRPPVIPGLPKEQVNLADWARFCHGRGALNRIIDPNLVGEISPVCLAKFGEIVDSCLRDQGTLRPSMGDVVFGLELVLQLQESKEESIAGDGGSERITEEESPVTLAPREAVTTDDDDLFSGSCGQKEESKSSISHDGRSDTRSDPGRLKSATVFSEIMSPQGR